MKPQRLRFVLRGLEVIFLHPRGQALRRKKTKFRNKCIKQFLGVTACKNEFWSARGDNLLKIEGRRSSFSFSSTLRCGLYLPPFAPIWAHRAGAFPSPALRLLCGFYLPRFRAGAFPSPALPLLCGFYLPPFALILPTGLAPFLVLPPFALMWPLLALWLLLATIRAYLANWAGAFPSPVFCTPVIAFPAITQAYLADWAGTLFMNPLLVYLPLFRLTWPTGLAPVLLPPFALIVLLFGLGACTFSFFGFATLAVSQLFFLLLSSSPSPLFFFPWEAGQIIQSKNIQAPLFHNQT